MKQKKSIIAYAKKLKIANLGGESCFICYRIDEKWAYYFSGNFENITEQTIEKINYTTDNGLAAKILRQKKGSNVVVFISPPKVMVVSAANVDIPPILDDMAQIIGVKVKVCPDNHKNILKEIKKSNAVIMANKGAVVTARTLNETLTCCMVLEKSATVHIASLVVGGCVYNGYLPSKLMRIVYKLKYSKGNQQKMLSEEK